MGVVNFLYHPDTVLTAADLEILALDLLAAISISGVEAAAFDSGIIRQTLLQAAVDQKSIKPVTGTTRLSYSDDYTLKQLHTVPADDLEAAVNDIFAQQAAMILGPGPRIICLDFVDVHYHGCPHADTGELCHTKPRDGTSKCHRYLAGFVLCRAKPLVVAVTPVRGDEPTSDAVERLLDHVAALPFTVAGLLADRGFYNGASIERLDTVGTSRSSDRPPWEADSREAGHDGLLLDGVRDVQGKRAGTAFPARGLCVLLTRQPRQTRVARTGLCGVRSD